MREWRNAFVCALVRSLVRSLVLAALAGAPVFAQREGDSCAPQRTALVLAGGGAKGFAHIGVLRVLDTLGIRPDLIVGTSVGAVMGALYASGYTGAEIDSIMRALPITDLIHPYRPRTPDALAPLPALAAWETSGHGLVLQTGAVDESQVTAVVNALMLRGNLLARGNFDRLPIPLRVVATDLTTRAAVVLGTGDLARAVRASSAIPLIFAPIDIDGRLLFDGGVANNTPVRIAQELGVQRTILSWLPPEDVESARLDDPFQIVGAMGRLLFNTDTATLGPNDVFIRNPTDGYNRLDLSLQKRTGLINQGVRAAHLALDGRCVRTLGAQRTPAVPLRVNDINVATETAIGGRPLRAALRLHAGAPVGEDSLRARLLVLGRSDAIRTLWLNPTGTDSLVDFNIQSARSGRRTMIVGLAYDNDLGGRLWGGIADRRLLGLSTEGAVSFDLNKYRTEFRATIIEQVAIGQRSIPGYAGVIARNEDVRRFAGDTELTAAHINEIVAALGARPLFAKVWSADIRAELRTWSEPEHRDGPTSIGGHMTIQRVSSTHQINMLFDVIANTDFTRAYTEVALPFRIARLNVEPRVHAGWGRMLPLGHTFVFGGNEGFAGVINGSRRGSQEALASLALSHQVIGPLFARVEFMSGAVGSGDGFLRKNNDPLRPYDGHFVSGVRAGIEVRTPALDIRLEQGYNDERRNVSFVRIGKWPGLN